MAEAQNAAEQNAAADRIREAKLVNQQAYPGPTQGQADGDTDLLARRHGVAWFRIRIPKETTRSIDYDGLALGANGLDLGTLAEGTSITADVVNEAQACALRLAVV